MEVENVWLVKDEISTFWNSQIKFQSNYEQNRYSCIADKLPIYVSRIDTQKGNTLKKVLTLVIYKYYDPLSSFNSWFYFGFEKTNTGFLFFKYQDKQQSHMKHWLV